MSFDRSIPVFFIRNHQNSLAGLHSTLTLKPSADCHVLFDMNNLVSRPVEAQNARSPVEPYVSIRFFYFLLFLQTHGEGFTRTLLAWRAQLSLLVNLGQDMMSRPQVVPQKPVQSLQIAAFGLHVASTLEPVAALRETLRTSQDGPSVCPPDLR